MAQRYKQFVKTQESMGDKFMSFYDNQLIENPAKILI